MFALQFDKDRHVGVVRGEHEATDNLSVYSLLYLNPQHGRDRGDDLAGGDLALTTSPNLIQLILYNLATVYSHLKKNHDEKGYQSYRRCSPLKALL